MTEVNLEFLKDLCSYGTRIRVRNAKTGQTVIEDVGCIANSKDARQKLKWDAYKSRNVHGINPVVKMSDKVSGVVVMLIEAYMYEADIDEARAMIRGGHE